MNVADLNERNGLFADDFHNVTAGQAVSVLEAHSMRDTVAEIVATRNADDAMTILDIPADVYEALAEFVKPRWPNVF